ncbi:tetratricopeptide repeat protein [Streptomyces sennicomposti]|uniref:tetratricopeptide repeat protein n=1 Tax=Streptomyces sennicomposti TaxID=2873384 RepID=UPI001CA7B5B9|nr:tetratricopeptide repeat protein [Streptomyces sennicomposti]MBY8865390.1 tetratricopeptide repeat protein [Streptomyces sennicomposti]
MGQRVTVTLPPEITPALRGLPRRDRTFSGRREELSTIAGEWERGPVVTIVGMPGVGKTALAVEAAWRAWKDEGRFPGGVLFFELHSYDNRNRVSTRQALAQSLTALAVPIETVRDDEQALTRLYRSVLAAYAERNRRLLVVVDDTSGEDEAEALLPADDYHAALVTSRHKLVLGGARMVLRPLDTDGAVELVRRELGADDARVDGDRASAERIADLCGHLPLAVRISAALLADFPVRPLAEFAAQLAEAHRRLDTLSRDERTVRAAFDLSYQRLRPDQARLFRLLALNPGPDVSTEAAGRLANAAVDRLLESLARTHLIEAPRWGRWTFHDLVRLYAEERASADTDEELRAAQGRLNSYYLETAADAALHLNDLVRMSNDGPLTRFLTNPGAGIAWLDEEYANLVATAVRAQEEGHDALSVVLPVALSGYLRLRRVLPQWTGLLEGAVSAGQSLGDVELTGIALDLLGLALQEQGRLVEAAVATRQAVKCFRQVDEDFRENVAWSHLGTVLVRQGRYEEAVEILRVAVDRLERQGGRMTSRAHALKDLGDALLRLGRFEEAEEFSREAANCFWQPVGDEISEAEACLCQGSALLALGAPALALIPLHRASEHFRKHENLAGLASTLKVYGRAVWALGHRDRAVDVLREAVECAAEAGNDGLRSEAVDELVSVYTMLGRTEEAARLAPAQGVRALPSPGTPSAAAASDGGRRRRFGWLSRRR